ncbi:hypothetical protein MMC19_000336 [Ptychographa xylographoides]|nr:hypothetical protein [Ptychographa xylographoides]
MALAPSKLLLYSSPLSGCSARVRIAALLKGILLEEKSLTISVSEEKPPDTSDETYLRMNPNATVPTLVATYPNGQLVTLTQSLSMLEFLEESYQGTQSILSPVTDMTLRTHARDLAALVACDIQPLQSARVRSRLESLNHHPVTWTVEMIQRGIHTYESLVSSTAGKYSVGNEISIADICLYPMLQNARRHHACEDSMLSRKAPTVGRIMQALQENDAFRRGGIQEVALFEERELRSANL